MPCHASGRNTSSCWLLGTHDARLKQGVHAEALLLLLELLLEGLRRRRRGALRQLPKEAAAELWGAPLRQGLLPGDPAAQRPFGRLRGLLLCKSNPAGTCGCKQA